MKAAAVASIFGVDPLTYLTLANDDRWVLDLVLEARSKLDDERDRGQRDYLASKTASMIVQPLTTWLGKSLPKLFRRA